MILTSLCKYCYIFIVESLKSNISFAYYQSNALKLITMVKALFISLNLVGLAMLPFLYVGNVSVEHQAPSEVEAGGSVEVTITLNKGTITGPARLKLDLADADGLTAEDIDNAGSSFSFSEGSGLFIWYSIQADEQVVLKYRINADAAASGTKTISGTFSYLDEEERKKMDIPSIVINVTGGTVATTSSTEVTEPETTITTETTPVVNDEVTCTRNVTKDGEDFIVSIDVSKGSNHGFARIKETIPAGFDATSIENEGAVFKFADNYAKFLWTSLDADKDVIAVSYRLTRTSAAEGTYNLDGVFSGEFLIENDVPKSITIPTGSITVEGEAVVAGNADPVDTDPVDVDPVDTTDPVGTTITTSNSNISYKVQVLAAHKTVSNSYIKRHYGYTGSVATENHEGWVKYTTGSFDIYKQARDKRNGLSSYNFPGPFVTAYNQGDRITVQEALMLSKQDWVK